MDENTSAKRPRMNRLSWGQVLNMTIAIGVALGAGAAVSSHDAITGIVVGAAIFINMIISYALIFRRRQR